MKAPNIQNNNENEIETQVHGILIRKVYYLHVDLDQY